MFPMKFFEYLAAGRPVVAAHVPALAEFSQACELVTSPDEFARAVNRVLRGDSADAGRGAQLARRFTWEWRMREMLALVEVAWQSRYAAPAAENWRAKAG